MADIKLSDHFSISKLLRFTWPTMMMMVFYTTYVMIDGIFVSNFIGSDAYAAVNLVGNYLLLFPVIGTMLGSGGAALISKTIGEDSREQASRQFSGIVWFSIIAGTVLTGLALLTVKPVIRLMGADEELLDLCDQYGSIVACSVVFYIIQSEFQYFFSMVEKESIGFISAVVSGVTNIALDLLFIVVFKWGLAGAAAASLLGIIFGGVFPIVYFLRHRDLPVRIGKPSRERGVLLKVCTNGSSEMVVNLSLSLVGMLFNFQMLRYAGENGVAAYGVVQAVTLVFMAVFEGYSAGTIPVVGYHFGSGNTAELKSLLRKCQLILSAMNILVFLVTEIFAETFAGIFVSYDRTLMDMSVRGLRLYSVMFLFASFNVFGSSFFTALNDGLNSALISLARTMVFLVACILVFPLLWGMDGIWFATPAAEILALSVTALITWRKRKKYQYM